jgi:hypothetical protein
MRPSDHPAVPLYGAGGPLDQGQRPVRSQRGRPFAVGDPSRANWISTFASAARFLEFRMLKIGPAPIRALPTPVSAVGKRNFPGQRQRPRNGPCNSMGRLQRQNACTNRRQFGAIRTEPGNLRLRRTAWWGWEMSHVGLDQILTQGAGRNGRFEAKQGFGSRFKSCHSDQFVE